MKIKIINELNKDPVLIVFDNDKNNKFRVAKDQLLGNTNLIAEQLRECARELVNYRTEKSER
ncbi:hypothetical protein [Pediococcus pentosaceus]|jgi:hypothetical protein|uniref:hypothetical protein n=1 Tax=Pediococcus pentosaceus TaxID=1255 RepID=UPI0021E86287|nr:hypothetical protein [Pediococcus pentosaceus]MCV3330433.1 hypothetical protein [Pediococcus pentosaceus]